MVLTKLCTSGTSGLSKYFLQPNRKSVLFGKDLKNSSTAVDPLSFIKSFIEENQVVTRKKKLEKLKGIRVLGNGSIRSQRCIAVQLEKANIFFNCGEDTLRLTRDMECSVHKSKGLFITYNSSENILGLLSLRMVFQNKSNFKVYGTKNLERFMNDVYTVNQSSSRYDLHTPSNFSEIQITPGIHIKSLQIEPDHGGKNHSYAYILKDWSQSTEHTEESALYNEKTSEGNSTYIVLEAPTLDHLDSLCSHSGFIDHQEQGSMCKKALPKIVVHFSPQNVVENWKYQEFIKKFPASTQHLVINESNISIGSVESRIYHSFYQALWPKAFPPLAPMTLQTEIPKGNIVPAAAGLLFDGFKFSTKSCKTFNFEDYKKMIRKPGGFKSLDQHVRKLQSISSRNETKVGFPNVQFLGSGSSYATLDRSTSAILLTIEHNKYAFLDCGYNVFGQLVTAKGYKQALKVLMNTSFLFVTHFHGDHHYGLLAMLSERQRAFDDLGREPATLYLLLDETVINYLVSFQDALGFKFKNLRIIPNSDTFEEREEIISLLREENNLKDIALNYVPHTRDSCAISITHQDGWKIVYSGDTRPSSSLIKFGMNCDLLIHEATLEDDFKSMAEHSKHSTISEAIEVAQQMKAKKCILTHFSQQYCHFPIHDKPVPDNIGFAADFAKIGLETDPQMKHFFGAVKNISAQARRKEKYPFQGEE